MNRIDKSYQPIMIAHFARSGNLVADVYLQLITDWLLAMELILCNIGPAARGVGLTMMFMSMQDIVPQI